MIGKTISHYRILSKLGAGGMGVVYQAEDTKLKRTVALKFLPPELTRDDQAKTRFIHEAQAASALQHNNICAIHEIDETPEGQLFISMDCYQGETLKEKIARGPLAVEEAVDIACQVAAGLSKAHDAGMVHRDVKPANIIVTSDGVVKILDFGLAKLAGMTKVTRTGTTVGTVAYMSPEQARGEEVDARSDIWSLGAVLYEMLTGQVPFPGDHEAAVLYGIVHGEPRPMTTSRTDLPRGIQQVAEKALQKDPGQRYQKADVLKNDLAALRPGMEAPHRGSKNMRLNAWRWRAVAVLLAIALIGTMVWKFLPRGSGQAKADEMALAVVDFHDLVSADDPTVAAGITSLVHVGLVESSPIRIVSPSYLYDLRRRLFGSGRGRIADDQALELARQSGATYMLSGQLTRIDDDQYLLWHLVNTSDGRSLGGRRTEGNDLAQLADRVIAEVLPLLGREAGVRATQPLSTAQISTDSEIAYRHFTAGKLAMETARPEEAIRYLREAVEVDSTFALAYLELSLACMSGALSIDEEASAIDYADVAWKLRARLGIKDRMRLEAQRALLGDRVTEVLTTCREMLDRWPDDREVLKSYAQALRYWWHGEEAAAVAERGLALYPDELGLGFERVAGLWFTGRLREALEAARINTEQHPQVWPVWDYLGESSLFLGLPDSAEATYRLALKIDPDSVGSQEGLARCAYSRGDLHRAIELYERILARSDLLPGIRVRLLVPYNAVLGLAGLYVEGGQFEKAMQVLEEGRSAASNDPRRKTLFENGENRVLLRAGRYDEVLSWVRGLGHVSGYRRQTSWYAGTAFVALDSLAEARSALENLELTDKEGYRKARFLIPHIRAQIALVEGKPDEALAALPDMGQYGANYEAWFFILWKETTARAYRMAGRLEEAEETHRELLRVFGGHALSHYELGQIYEEMKRPAEAKKEYEKFLKMWSEADEGLPQLVDAKQRLARL